MPWGGRRSGTLTATMEPSRVEIHEALSRVIDPELRKPVTELDMVRGVTVDGGAHERRLGPGRAAWAASRKEEKSVVAGKG